ncbi:MAG: hypothetical protein J3K34DRAFT_515847 [Monoraphidium minutum]|nr:MAG: hypothetical protein J3K34DRAFT_515847 [Monoraphidium minutum]
MATYRGLVNCCICFGGKEADWAMLACGHVFHEPCVTEWINCRKPAACPMCRARAGTLRRLVGVESQLEAGGDEGAVAEHLLERARELRGLQDEAAARAAAAEGRAADAQEAAAEAAAARDAAERAASKAERGAARAASKLEAATQQIGCLVAQLSDASGRELALRQELHAAGERAATEAFRLRSRLKEAELAAGEARRRLAALQLSSKGLTLDTAQSILQGEESPLAQVLLARNAELAAAERQVEAARAEVQAAREQGAAALASLEGRHRAELAREAEAREKLRRRELQLEYERDSQARRARDLEVEVAELRGVLLPRLLSFLGGGGPDAPSFLGLGRAAPGQWTGAAQGSLVRQGPDGRGGMVRHLAPLTNTAGSRQLHGAAKRPGGAQALLPLGPPAKQRRPGDQQRPAAGGGGGGGSGGKQTKLSSFFAGGKGVR